MRRDSQAPRRGRSAPGQADPEVLADALDWSIDRLADHLSIEEPRPATRPPWGLDAGEDAAAYAYWMRARHERAWVPGSSPVAGGPLLSVVVPVYRPELWYFRECVASVQAQTYPDWELCICDDASGDDSLGEFIEQLARSDRRVRATFLDANGGISAATNKAISTAKGDFVALLDHDDLLEPDALAQVAAVIERVPDTDILYSDDDKVDENGHHYDPHFKPDWAPDLLLSYPYMGHLLVIRRGLIESIGGFRSEFDGSQDYDVMLRATEASDRVVHIPEVLYHWRAVAGSAAGEANAKVWAHDASKRVLEETLDRRGVSGSVNRTSIPGWYHVRREVSGRPRVAIIIPFRDQAALTTSCLASLSIAPGYDEYELVLVDNASAEPETAALVGRMKSQGVKVIDYPGMFNWSVINNLAASSCDAELLLFMNNDVEALSQGWLHGLVELAQREDVGAVGARLVMGDGMLQHAGVVLGLSGIAGHLFTGMPPGLIGYAGWDRYVRPYSAVTGACLMSRRRVFEEVGGFDEQLEVAYNDVDYCMRLVDSGYRVLYTPHAELVHHESVSRGMSGFFHDMRYLLGKWDRERLWRDPLFNPNLSLFAPWCALREPDEDEKWNDFIDELQGV